MRLRLISAVAAISLFLFACAAPAPLMPVMVLATVPMNLATIPFGAALPFTAGIVHPMQMADGSSGEIRSYGQATTGPLGNISGVISGIPVVGNYESYNEVVVGRVLRNLNDDSEELEIRLVNSNVNCSGKLFPPDDGFPLEWPIALRNCLNRIAKGTLACSDGRELVLDWRATQCQVAYGEGFDRDGGTLRFEVLDNRDTAADKARLLTAQLSPYPPLPLVR